MHCEQNAYIMQAETQSELLIHLSYYTGISGKIKEVNNLPTKNHYIIIKTHRLMKKNNIRTIHKIENNNFISKGLIL